MIERSIAARRLFTHSIFDEPRSMTVLRRVIVPLLIAHVILAMWSGYRAIVQVFRLDLRVPDTQIHEGSTVALDVVSSGRVPVTARLEMIQGAHSETLAVTRVPNSVNPSYDPRTKSASLSVAFSATVLSHFTPGGAHVRGTAVGASQWLRTPPPTVRDVVVNIDR